MSREKRVLLIILVVFGAIQFIQPSRNASKEILQTDITRVLNVPQRVQDVLISSCYDCHSNNTHYPWYSFIQPGAWWMAHHIKEGKQNLNFSEFGSYSNRKQRNKLRSIENSIILGTMPIRVYTILHTDAKLTKVNQQLIVTWTDRTRDSISKTN